MIQESGVIVSCNKGWEAKVENKELKWQVTSVDTIECERQKLENKKQKKIKIKIDVFF